MSKRLRTNLLLACVLIGLVLGAWLGRDKPAPADPLLTDLSADELDEVRLQFADGMAIHLQRREQVWWLNEPVEVPANPFEVSSLLSLPGRSSHRRFAAADADLAQLGLAPARASLLAGGIRLDIGGTAPISGQRYIRIDDTVHLIDEISESSFDADYADLVSRRLLPEIGEITGLRLPELQLRRDGASWRVDPPQAEPEQLARLANAWASAEALWVVRPLQSEHAQAGHKIQVTGSGGQITLLLLSREPQFQLIRPDLDLNYVLAPSAAAELLELTTAESK